MERWKKVLGFEDTYKISSLGRVKSLKKKLKFGCGYRIKPESILSSTDNGKGYLYNDLYYGERKKKRIYVHQLVAKMFRKNPLNLKEVNHKDLNKQNNNYKNLEWCTHQQNQKHAFENGKLIPPNLRKKLKKL